MKKERFLAAGVHIGMKARTGFMKDYVYKIRSNGLTVMNLQIIREKLEAAGKFLSKFEPDKILAVAEREQARNPLRKFAQVTGCQAIVGRFLPGTLTNHVREVDVLLVSDLVADHQAVTEAYQTGIPIVALANVNDIPAKVDLLVPCNNRGKKSLATVFWALSTFVKRYRGELDENEDVSVPVEDFLRS